jgi:hypothetical protein
MGVLVGFNVVFHGIYGKTLKVQWDALWCHQTWCNMATPSCCSWENPQEIVVYPLVNVYITMENHHFQWVNPL